MVVVLSGGILFNSGQVILQVRVSVREAVGEELVVVIEVEAVSEGQSEVVSLESWIAVLLEIVLVVVNAFPNSVPSCSLDVIEFV